MEGSDSNEEESSFVQEYQSQDEAGVTLPAAEVAPNNEAVEANTQTESADGEMDMESNIDTFLEFTGSTDRQRALQYLMGSGGRLEQAVNLFLSGAPPQPEAFLNFTTAAQAVANDVDALESLSDLMEGENDSQVNRLLREHLNALVQESVPDDADRREEAHGSRLGSHLTALFRHRRNRSSNRHTSSRSGHLPPAGLRQLVSGLTSAANSRLDIVGDLLTRNKIVLDDPKRIDSQLESLRSGLWEKSVEIGAACLRKASITEKYLDFGLAELLEESLPIAMTTADDDSTIRVLQLTEATMRIVCDGHRKALENCSWWFIPARRLTSRRYGRNNLVETFLERVLPTSDLEFLEHLWYSESFDPSWRDRKTEAEMLACSLAHGCSIEFLDFLVDPVNGCRANVNPERERLGKLKRPLFLAAAATGVTKNSKVSVDGEEEEDMDLSTRKESWSKAAVEILLDAGCSLDTVTPSDLASFTAAARKLIAQEQNGTRVSERLLRIENNSEEVSVSVAEKWRLESMPKLFVALLHAVASARSTETKHRSLEVLSLLVQRLRPAPSYDIHRLFQQGENEGAVLSQFMELLQSIYSSASDDKVASELTLGILQTLLQVDVANSENNEFKNTLCLCLCRFGITMYIKEDANAVSVYEAVYNNIVHVQNLPEETLVGKSKQLMDICSRLQKGEGGALTSLVDMLNEQHTSAVCSGITAFEFEASGIVVALAQFLLDPSDPTRMQQFLTAMPPPVLRSDKLIPKAVSTDEDQSDEEEELDSDEDDRPQESKQNTTLTELTFDQEERTRTMSSTSGRRRSSTAYAKSVSLPEFDLGLISEDVEPSCSALYKLVNNLQVILTLNAEKSFPVLNHDAPGGGIRALVNPIKLKLLADRGMYPQSSCVSVNVLPLTPIRELELQVIRSLRLTDPRYLEFCKRLVGCKVQHRLRTSKGNNAQSIFQLGVVVGFDGMTCAHQVQDIDDSGVKQWLVMALREYKVLGRVSEPVEHVENKIKFIRDVKDRKRTVVHKCGDSVAVWWEGGNDVRPGWRRGEITKVLNDSFDIQYTSPDLIFDDILRVGDLVQLTEDLELLELVGSAHNKYDKDMIPFAGEMALVTNIQGKSVTTDGLGGHVYHVKVLRKMSKTSSRSRLDVGDKVVLSASAEDQDGLQEGETGVIMENDKSWRPFLVRLPDGDARWYRSRDLELATPRSITTIEKDVDIKRVRPLEGLSSMDRKHIFTVYLSPTAMLALQDSHSVDEPVFRLNDRIEAKYAGRSRWYSGRIARVNAGGTYDIAYDDGDSERGVKADLICHIGQGAKSAVSFDFRKVFPDSCGRALFDALRREDTVLNTLYNFITRGFVHQPQFYANFSETLAKTGKGVFAKFQTRQQAEILYDRILRTQSEAEREVELTVGIGIEPDDRPPHTVERDILAAFERAAARTGEKQLKKQPPLPGNRAQIQVAFEEDTCTLKWVSGTVIGKRKDLYTCVLDSGVVIYDVPADQVRKAQRTSGSMAVKSVERTSAKAGMLSPKKVGERKTELSVVETVDPAEPVELTRQFTAFGHSTSYKRIRVESKDSLDPFQSVVESLADEELYPPQIQVTFSNGDSSIVSSNLHGEMSMFQALHQLFHASVKGGFSTWDTEYELTCSYKCLFPGDEELEVQSRKWRSHSEMVHQLPWSSPEELATQIDTDSTFTTQQFYDRLKACFNEVDQWAEENALDFSSGSLSWAEITVAYAQLCRQPLQSPKSFAIPKPRRNSVIAEECTIQAKETEDEITTVAKECDIEAESVVYALLILKLLHTELVDTVPQANYETGVVASPGLNYAFAKSLPWRNVKMSEQLSEQLGDPLSIATRCFPKWCWSLPRSVSFLFRTRDRQVHMRCTALGVSRAVAWLQDEVTGYKAKKRQLAQITLEISSLFRGVPDMTKAEKLQDRSDRLEDELRSIEQEHCIGQLQQDLVKVDRNSLLHDAEALMRQHMHQRSELVVQFIGETGAGDGVTVDFYASVAAELQRVSTNKACPMWADRIDHGDTAAENKENSHLMQSRGLFPQPLLPIGGTLTVDSDRTVLNAAVERNNNVVARFRFLGRLMAKAFLDDKHVPLPLALGFFVLVKNRLGSSSHSQLLPITALGLVEGGSSEEGAPGTPNGATMGLIATLYKWWKMGDWENIKNLLESVDLRFVDPSQPTLNESTTEQSNLKQGISVFEEKGEEADLKEPALMVPSASCEQSDVDEYAVQASKLGYSQSKIDAELSQQGIPKLQRWKAIKASQKIRTEIALEQALKRENDKLKDPSVMASELTPNGESVVVTVDNLPQYLKSITSWWLEEGIKRQADAFQEGLQDVLGRHGSYALLHNFSPSELRKMLCGKQEVQWNDDDPLLGCLVPMGSYTAESESIQMLVKCLQKMNMNERSEFLSFVTSQPRVPLSGLPQIKVYPPMMECVNGIELVQDDPKDGTIYVDDEVELSSDYALWGDASHGPLRPGETGIVMQVDSRANVQGWWYNLKALRRKCRHDESQTAEQSKRKAEWFKPGDFVKTSRAHAIVEKWLPEENKLIFAKRKNVTGMFVKGQKLHGTDPPLRVSGVLEQPEAIQMPPYLRPKATTCAKTMYLPEGYEDYKHMLRIFREAFEDAKLGGMND